MPITKSPEMVACAGAVLVSSESRERDPVLTVTLNTEEGDRYMLPLIERGDNATDRSNQRVAPHARLSRPTGDFAPINGARVEQLPRRGLP
jgi:hypothetical protein